MHDEVSGSLFPPAFGTASSPVPIFAAIPRPPAVDAKETAPAFAIGRRPGIAVSAPLAFTG